ncbi:MAG: hypothetical protein FWC50_02605 [Planctomycetaceae bacterium]|nr:hypothetical protein [Planctomycetaceae bacterium]
MNELKRIHLQEFVLGTKKHGVINRTGGIISGVKILGTVSRNNRRYPVETLQHAVSMYENAKVNLNHPAGDPTQPRQYQDRFGVVRNVRVAGDDGLFADFHFNPKHQFAEQLLWDAENAPENVGFSHNIEAEVVQENETLVVKRILAVRSVDIVADPATTQGLFESHENALQNAPYSENVHENESLRKRLKLVEQFSRQLIAFLAERHPQSGQVFNDLFVQSIFEGDDLALVEKLIGDRMTLAGSLMSQQTILQTASQVNTEPRCREQFESVSQPGNAKNFVELICR